MMRILGVALTLGLLLSSCSKTSKVQDSIIVEIDQAKLLADMMTGSYTSAKQALADSNYYSISLHMYPVWQNRNGHYLYVEQALSSKQNEPYRQRIYKIEALPNGTLTSTLYSLMDEDRFVGKYAEPGFFNQYDESILELREGCTVYMKKTGATYTGSTKEKECKSTLRGASYATAQVKIEATKVESWDRGFDANDEHVWGADKGAYVFELIRKVVPNYNHSENGIRFKDSQKIQIKE